MKELFCESKKCQRCSKVIEVGRFYKDKTRKDGLSAYCIRCESDRKKEARENNPELVEKHKKNNRVWYQNNKQKNKDRSDKWKEENPAKYREWNLKRRFGISLEEYDTILYSQGCCCAICGIHRDYINEHLSVDHCHSSGKIRGLLCKSCNSGLGFFQDDLEIMNKALKYLTASNKIEERIQVK